MATTTASQVPVEVYLRSSFEPDAEYVDGEVQERTVGELDHAAWQAAVQKWFWQREKEWGIRAFGELRVQVSPSRFRVPDVVVLENTGPLREMNQVVRTPPAAVFEILSPEDTLARLLEKLADYEAMGIRGIFVIDPKGRRKYRYLSGDLRQIEGGDILIGQIERKFEFREMEGLLG
jgi:Uma2 family endonuclease